MAESFLLVAQQVLMLYLIMAVGFVLGKARLIDDRGSVAMSNLVIYAVSPSILVVAFQRELDMASLRNFGLVLLVALAVHILAAVSVLLVRDKDPQRQSCLRFAVVFANCGFMGYPIILAINPDWMIYAVAYNVAYLLVSWTVGVSLFQGRQNVSLKRVLLNPNVIAAFLGFAVFCLNITLPDILSQTMSLIGGLTTPLSMLLIGTRISGIRLSELRDKDYHITAALRLIVLPLILYVLLLPLHLDPAVWSTLYLLTAMPCGTLSAMQAELYGGDARFAARAIAYSTLLSLVTVPLVSMLL